MNEEVVQAHTIWQEQENCEAKSMDRFKVTHTYPNITPEKNEEIQKDILMKMYNLYNQDKKIETKVNK